MSDGPSPLAGGLLLAVRCFAGIRLGFLAVAPALAGAQTLRPTAFVLVLVPGAIYALALAGLALWHPEPLLHWRRLGLVDLALLCGLALSSPIEPSPLRFAFYAIPFLVAFVARPARAVLWSCAALGGFALVWVAAAPAAGGAFPRAIVVELASLAFASLVAVAFSAVLIRLHGAVVEHARRASALAAAIVRVEARERRKLADALHDGAVQQIASASRELGAALAGEHSRLPDAQAALDRALDELRGEIFDLYPHILDVAGLEAAVEELTRRAARRGAFATSVRLDPEAVGIDDVTVLAVLRELLTNAAKHAGATRVDVSVATDGEEGVRVEVRDDGCGFVPPTPEQAAEGRHFGLHATSERLRALGGALMVRSEAGSGTVATARIPAVAPSRPRAAA